MTKLKVLRTRIALFGIAGLMLGLSNAGISSASLIYLNEFNASGQGYGAVDNILSMHNTGVTGGAGQVTDEEYGKVAWNGTSDVITGTWALTDPNKTATFSFGYLGINDASQIRLIWDPSEIGSSSGDDTEVFALTMSIYRADGNFFWSASLANPVFHDHVVNPGLGVGDFVYGLDGAQASDLNTLLASEGDFSSFRIGLESTVRYVDDGPDSWLIGRGPGNPVPEPATLILFGTGLAGLASLTRRKRE